MQTLSSRTKQVIASANVLNQNETYPDNTATSGFQTARIDTTDGLMRLDKYTVPRTSEDMSKLFKWRRGSGKLYGTHATKEEIGMNSYIDDILSAPDENDYKPIYIDTFRELNPQFKKYKR